MRGHKKYWKNEYEYIRIKEILDAYWLEEPDEISVCVKMYFQKSDGQTQEKTIRWVNPNYECTDITKDISEFPELSMMDLLNMEFPEAELPYVDVNKYRKKGEHETCIKQIQSGIWTASS